VATAPTLTYWKDVAPSLNDACVKCQQAGGVAPIQLDSYAEVKVNAAAIAAATSPRLDAWSKSAHLEGTEVTLERPAVLSLSSGEDSQTPTLVPVAQGGVLVQDDEYRCYPFGNAAGVDRFITGFEVTPGSKTIVHHAPGFVVDPARVNALGSGQRRGDDSARPTRPHAGRLAVLRLGG
jgi:hypothetical protein